MKLDYIYLDSYKNLKDFEVAFNEGSSVNALIGNNGSGKSNVLEALATAFAAVYNEQTIDFIYDICYRINNSKYRISNRGGTIFTKDGKNVRKAEVLFTTHSPLTLGKMRKENIRILKDGQVFEPSADTFNRDITEVLEEIMDVGKRPVDVEKAMRDFRNSVIHGNKKDALIHENTLRELLSRDDPFWVTAGHLLSRMGD